MEQSQHPFSEAGFDDIEAATELFSMLKIDPNVMFPDDITKLNKLAEFVSSFDDGLLRLEGAMRRLSNPSIKPIDHLIGYVNLQNKKLALKGELEKIDNEISLYE